MGVAHVPHELSLELLLDHDLLVFLHQLRRAHPQDPLRILLCNINIGSNLTPCALRDVEVLL